MAAKDEFVGCEINFQAGDIEISAVVVERVLHRNGATFYIVREKGKAQLWGVEPSDIHIVKVPSKH